MELLLERVARRLQGAGWRVGGLVHRQDRYANGNKRMQLFDLRSDRQFELSQDLGCASRACSLNPQALAQASAVLRQALDDGVDLVVINRFGIVEASGQGFAAEFAVLSRPARPCSRPSRPAILKTGAGTPAACMPSWQPMRCR